MPQISPDPLSRQHAALRCIKAAARHCAGLEEIHPDDKDDYPCRLDAQVPVDGEIVKATFFFKNSMQRGIASAEIGIRLGRIDPILPKAFNAEVIDTAPKRVSVVGGLGNESLFSSRSSRGEPPWLDARLKRLSETPIGATPDSSTKEPSAGSGKLKGSKPKKRLVAKEAVAEPESSAVSAEAAEPVALDVELLSQDLGTGEALPVTGLEDIDVPAKASHHRGRSNRAPTHAGLNALKNALLETCYNRGLQFLGKADESIEVGNAFGQPGVTIQMSPQDYQLRIIIDPKRSDFKELVEALEQKIHDVSYVDRYRKHGHGEFLVTVKS